MQEWRLKKHKSLWGCIKIINDKGEIERTYQVNQYGLLKNKMPRQARRQFMDPEEVRQNRLKRKRIKHEPRTFSLDYEKLKEKNDLLSNFDYANMKRFQEIKQKLSNNINPELKQCFLNIQNNQPFEKTIDEDETLDMNLILDYDNRNGVFEFHCEKPEEPPFLGDDDYGSLHNQFLNESLFNVDEETDNEDFLNANLIL
ncbi:hypothetical protein TRFO_05791 [Tritrichomonas foetus]|uniref:Uncharacterized protein n=1 Tax=Tritrichomonas foetus TaxID=1144522 RepID=A0A1J4K8A7_9EUKA|nr:hypothetical protein TRFO_05791 [Tritrichomonas foetus]|eukprot:OHT05669.1 hypothetical protein TRFO_05791 [Tritrichomonas foetus]